MSRHFVSILFSLLVILWLGGYIYFALMTDLARPEQRTEKTDAIIVLPGGYYRVMTGLGLLADGLAPELFITGANISSTDKDIRALWKDNTKPLPACCITLGYEAQTTWGNALEAKTWIEKKNLKSIRLVTSTYHLQRSLLEFQYAMPGIKIIPHPVEEEDFSLHEPAFWMMTFYEYNKYITRGFIISVLKGFG